MGARLQHAIPKMVSLAQSSFILGRRILDNVILAIEVIKGYGSKSLSSRCMIKIDLKKVYDSMEWPFLEGMLNALGSLSFM